LNLKIKDIEISRLEEKSKTQKGNLLKLAIESKKLEKSKISKKLNNELEIATHFKNNEETSKKFMIQKITERSQEIEKIKSKFRRKNSKSCHKVEEVQSQIPVLQVRNSRRCKSLISGLL
jgi:hypothetical protein